MAQMSVGTMPHAQVLHAIELLGTEVAPAVRGAVARRRTSAGLPGGPLAPYQLEPTLFTDPAGRFSARRPFILREQVLYMVIERFRDGAAPVYARAAEQGRMLPEGLAYVNSWIDDRCLARCFQLMETDEPDLLREWTERWDDLVEFEIIPVVTSAEAVKRIGSNN